MINLDASQEGGQMKEDTYSLFRLVGSKLIRNHDHQPHVTRAGTAWLVSGVPNQVAYAELLCLIGELAAERTM